MKDINDIFNALCVEHKWFTVEIAYKAIRAWFVGGSRFICDMDINDDLLVKLYYALAEELEEQEEEVA